MNSMMKRVHAFTFDTVHNHNFIKLLNDGMDSGFFLERHDKLGVGNVKSLFGTAPNFWNALLGLMAQLPSSLLANEPIMEKLALFSLPIVRVVDSFAGATNAMRCDLICQKDPTLNSSALYAHENLEPCVGECVVAFCSAVLSGNVKPGT